MVVVPVGWTVALAVGAMVVGMLLVLFAVRFAVREILCRALAEADMREAMDRHPSGSGNSAGKVFPQQDSGSDGEGV